MIPNNSHPVASGSLTPSSLTLTAPSVVPGLLLEEEVPLGSKSQGKHLSFKTTAKHWKKLGEPFFIYSS